MFMHIAAHFHIHHFVLFTGAPKALKNDFTNGLSFYAHLITLTHLGTSGARVECVPFIQLHPERSALDLLFIFTYSKGAAERY